MALRDVARVSRDTHLKLLAGGVALAAGCLYTLPRAEPLYGDADAPAAGCYLAVRSSVVRRAAPAHARAPMRRSRPHAVDWASRGMGAAHLDADEGGQV